MRYLSYDEIVALHDMVIQQSGGGAGIRDDAALKSAVAQPSMAFGGTDLYPTPAAKAGALGFALIQNHPFVDGNKRIGHAAAEVFLRLNGYEIAADIDVQEAVILDVAAGNMSREDFTSWIEQHCVEVHY